jgi:hypothetical protein
VDNLSSKSKFCSKFFGQFGVEFLERENSQKIMENVILCHKWNIDVCILS